MNFCFCSLLFRSLAEALIYDPILKYAIFCVIYFYRVFIINQLCSSQLAQQQRNMQKYIREII